MRGLRRPAGGKRAGRRQHARAAPQAPPDRARGQAMRRQQQKGTRRTCVGASCASVFRLALLPSFLIRFRPRTHATTDPPPTRLTRKSRRSLGRRLYVGSQTCGRISMLQLFFVAGVALAPPPIQRVEDLRYIKATGVWELHLPDGALVQPPKPVSTPTTLDGSGIDVALTGGLPRLPSGEHLTLAEDDADDSNSEVTLGEGGKVWRGSGRRSNARAAHSRSPLEFDSRRCSRERTLPLAGAARSRRDLRLVNFGARLGHRRVGPVRCGPGRETRGAERRRGWPGAVARGQRAAQPRHRA